MSEQIVLDAEKLKGLSKVRTFKDREGKEVSKKEITLNKVALKEPKLLKSTDKYEFIKTHFICVPLTKEERENGKETIYVGEVFKTEWKEDKSAFDAPASKPKGNSIFEDDDNLPF